MAIKNVEGLTKEQIKEEIERGGRFTMFYYCFSILVITFKRTSSVYFIKSCQSSFAYSWKYTLITTLFGIWGIPWGIIYTPQCIVRNVKGGMDVSAEVLQSLGIAPTQAVLE